MPIRILHVVTYMGRGGLETMLMNCYRHIDREQVQFDFLVHRQFRADYDDEIESLGGRIYRLPRLNPFNPGYYKALRNFFREHPEYRIVHCHLDCMSAFPLGAAKQAGVPVRIAHSHNSNQDRDWKYLLKRYFMKKTPAAATHFFACSKDAGEFMFPGQDVTVINNGIETEKYAFSPKKRTAIRQELGLGNAFVIGHVGRFMPQKNHDFLIDIFAAVHKRMTDAKLLLVGNGPLEDTIHTKVSSLGLDSHVMFLGLRSDVHNILQAMDIFVMPSVYEGLPLVTIEAQTSGLHCVVSLGVSRGCNLTGNVTFLPLNAGCDAWAESILAADYSCRKSCQNAVTDAGYDIQATANYLQKFYTEMWCHE